MFLFTTLSGVVRAAVVVSGLWAGVAHATTNLALNGTAYGSSAQYGPASAAIDGNTNTTYAGGSIFQSAYEANPYWVVDLGANFSLSQINIYQRTDELPRLLHDFNVTVFDSLGQVTFSQAYATDAGATVSTPFDIVFSAPVLGKAIQIILNEPNYLALAEVQVMGNSLNATDVPEPASMVLLMAGLAGLGATRRALNRAA